MPRHAGGRCTETFEGLMRSPRSLATFLLALSGFLVGGVGVLLLAPHAGRPAHAAHAARTAQASPAGGTSPTVPAAVVAAMPSAPDQFNLLSDATSITRPGEPSRIVISSIKLDAKVVDVGIVTDDKGNSAWDTAAFAVGFQRGSALPGAPGNTVMNGHISSPVSHKGDVFRHLPEVRIGDEIDVYVGDRRVAYAVTALQVVPPTAIQVLNSTPDATLTLITCYPDNIYTNRLIVIGKLTGS
jgi:sortase A